MTADLRLINASAGTGEAVRSLVTVTRSIGATVLTVDATTNWPAYFIATTGSLDTNGRLAPATIQVFKGHKSGSTYIIDSFAPGYTDKGNVIGDVVLVKPATAWADQVSEFMGISNNQDGTLKPSAVQTALQSVQLLDWLPTNLNVTSVTYNGNRNYTLGVSADPRTFISPGMRLRTTRAVAAPTQSTSLNGTTQYYSKTSPAGMTFTDDFTLSAWVKITSYQAGTIISRMNSAGTQGFRIATSATGQVFLEGYTTAGGGGRFYNSYQSIPLNRWVHIAGSLDMSAAVGLIYLDGVLVPSVLSSGTGTALIQAGNLEVGSYGGGLNPLLGKVAQPAVFSSILSASTIRSYMSQGLTGSEPTLVSGYSFNNSINDLNTTNANNLTANGTAIATNADSPFGGQANSTISSTLDYAVVQTTSASTLNVQVPEGNTIPTTGGVSSLVYSAARAPYGAPIDKDKMSLYFISVTAVSGVSPATWANLGSILLNVPIGAWNLKANIAVQFYGGGIISLGGILSISPSATTSTADTIRPYLSYAQYYDVAYNAEKAVSLATATTYYVVGQKTTASTNIVINPDFATSTFIAENTFV